MASARTLFGTVLNIVASARVVGGGIPEGPLPTFGVGVGAWGVELDEAAELIVHADLDDARPSVLIGLD